MGNWTKKIAPLILASQLTATRAQAQQPLTVPKAGLSPQEIKNRYEILSRTIEMLELYQGKIEGTQFLDDMMKFREAINKNNHTVFTQQQRDEWPRQIADAFLAAAKKEMPGRENIGKKVEEALGTLRDLRDGRYVAWPRVRELRAVVDFTQSANDESIYMIAERLLYPNHAINHPWQQIPCYTQYAIPLCNYIAQWHDNPQRTDGLNLVPPAAEVAGLLNRDTWKEGTDGKHMIAMILPMRGFTTSTLNDALKQANIADCSKVTEVFNLWVISIPKDVYIKTIERQIDQKARADFADKHRDLLLLIRYHGVLDISLDKKTVPQQPVYEVVLKDKAQLDALRAVLQSPELGDKLAAASDGMNKSAGKIFVERPYIPLPNQLPVGHEFAVKYDEGEIALVIPQDTLDKLQNIIRKDIAEPLNYPMDTPPQLRSRRR